MHIGHQINTQYVMESAGKSVQLVTTKEEKYLGVDIVDNLKPSLQCTKSSNKAIIIIIKIVHKVHTGKDRETDEHKIMKRKKTHRKIMIVS